MTRVLVLFFALLFAANARAQQVTVTPTGEWFIEKDLSNPNVTVLYHWAMESKFIVYHGAKAVKNEYKLGSALKDCNEAKSRGHKCTRIRPIPSVLRSLAFTISSKNYKNARVAYVEYRSKGRKVTLYFYGSWDPKVNVKATSDFNQMVRSTNVRF